MNTSNNLIIGQQVEGTRIVRRRVNLATGKSTPTHSGLMLNKPFCTCPRCGRHDAYLAYLLEFATDDISKEGYCPDCHEWWMLDIRRAAELSLEQWFCLTVACGLAPGQVAIVGPDESE
jgi:hypothetical protein